MLPGFLLLFMGQLSSSLILPFHSLLQALTGLPLPLSEADTRRDKTIGKTPAIILPAQHLPPTSHMVVAGPSVTVLSTPGPAEWSHDIRLANLNILISSTVIG